LLQVPHDILASNGPRRDAASVGALTSEAQSPSADTVIPYLVEPRRKNVIHKRLFGFTLDVNQQPTHQDYSG
jgi:hypothetical protein